ncbi:transcriptional regulator with XRE-family HTH domain [Actinokineospora baliensis]|uniref:helix-turn-helix domain-containing protein n=1 Tax=Actinokineospora baliensis TaxID=547056 RepID=UPI00195A3323|nr:XRE family transcriptional regulator [Actinokineospora baliensis]MBM7769947.1 transcriptional regulator with XRE-family HTH domain [Actinokineospora baliensis]
MGWSEVGERVRQCRLAANLSQDDLGRAVGLERSKIAKVEAGDRRVDAMELARLADALGVPMSHFLTSQPHVLSQRTPLTEDSGTETARHRYRVEAQISSWLRDVRQLIDLGVLQRSRPLFYGAAAATPTEARAAALWTRDQLGLGEEPIDTVMAVCEQAGQLMLVTDLPGDGASLIDDDIAVAVVGRAPEPGRRRATAAHELGHLVLGDAYSAELGLATDREQIIDAFAAELLLPRSVVRRVDGEPRRATLTRLAATYRTSWSLAVRQAISAGIASPAEFARLSAVAPTRAELRDAVGWAPQPDLEHVLVPPSFAHAVMTAWQRDMITSARAVELMHGQITEDDLPARPVSWSDE